MAQPLDVRPVVMSGPSGSGKSTLLKALMQRHANVFAFSVSHTTRSPRAGEVDGVDYYFSDKETMSAAISKGDFLESAEFAGNLYGTSKSAVDKVLKSGRICILDLEIEGVKSLKAHPELNARFVFIRPPSLKILENRLRTRGTESEDKVTARLARAQADLDYAEVKGSYDLVVVNDDLDVATAELEGYLLEDIQRVKMQQYQSHPRNN